MERAGFDAFFESTHRHLGIYKIVLGLSSCTRSSSSDISMARGRLRGGPLASDGSSVQSPSSRAGGPQLSSADCSIRDSG